MTQERLARADRRQSAMRQWSAQWSAQWSVLARRLCLMSWLGLPVACVAAAAHPAPAESGATIPDSPAVAYARDPVAIRRGRLIFIGTCGAYCHALHGGSRGDVPDLFDCEWRHGSLDADIFHTIATGVPGTRMVGFKDALPEKETDVWKVVAFLRATSNCKRP